VEALALQNRTVHLRIVELFAAALFILSAGWALQADT